MKALLLGLSLTLLACHLGANVSGALTGYSLLAPSPGGTLVAIVAGDRASVVIAEAGSGREVHVIDAARIARVGEGGVTRASWSPDSRALALEVTGDETAKVAVFDAKDWSAAPAIVAVGANEGARQPQFVSAKTLAVIPVNSAGELPVDRGLYLYDLPSRHAARQLADVLVLEFAVTAGGIVAVCEDGDGRRALRTWNPDSTKERR